MDVTAIKEGEVLVATVSGRLDPLTAPELGNTLAHWIGEGEAVILLDISGLAYISSAGLRVLLNAGKRLRASGGSISLAGPGELVREVLETSGLTSVFSVYGSVGEALEHL